jgi:taurine dioxygenase
MPTPPAATCLFGITIPPVGGDTIFVDQHKALDDMPAELRERLSGKIGKHSARQAYSNNGQYAADNYDGAMTIRTSDEANAVQGHPLIRDHPETGRQGIFGGSYVFGLQSTPDDQASALLGDLNSWLDRPEFHYRHVWQANMLIMWDNRSVLHKATGGYEGHARLLHRLTVADDADYYL